MFVAASFYRGGTSRGLVFSASALAPFKQSVRDRIICAAMGSPDPDLRQIDGLGGGVSSLSKSAIVSVPAIDRYHMKLKRMGEAWRFPGVEWADNREHATDPNSGYDIVYRFGQVPVNEGTNVDWSTTCGNFVSAVALHAYFSASRYFAARILPEAEDQDKMRFPMRVLFANSGERAKVHIPLVRTQKGNWHYSNENDTHIAGVPGKAPGLQLEMPLASNPWPTGKPINTVQLDGKDVRISVVQVGLPTVFVQATDLGISPQQITQSASVLDTDTALRGRVEALRFQAAQCSPELQKLWSPSAPKVCIVHPRMAYTTSGGEHVRAEDMDILVRAVSVGNFHRSIMATGLSALAVASSSPESVVSEAYAQGGGTPCAVSKMRASAQPNLRAFTVGQPAGASMAMVQLDESNHTPSAVVMDRTARRIMTGLLDIPPMDEMTHSLEAYGINPRDWAPFGRRNVRSSTAQASHSTSWQHGRG